MSTSPLKIGDKAPDFTLPTDKGEDLSLAELKGKKIVLYFYPKDNTPGCTIEANDFKTLIHDYAQRSTVVIGVSKDSVASHVKFRDKCALPFDLLSDIDATICKAYGVYVEKSMFGKKYFGIERTTFLIDEQGIIKEIWRKVKVKGHAKTVLDRVKTTGA